MDKDLEARIRKEGLDPADFQKAWDKLAEYYEELAKRKEECKRNGSHLKPNVMSTEYGLDKRHGCFAGIATRTIQGH